MRRYAGEGDNGGVERQARSLRSGRALEEARGFAGGQGRTARPFGRAQGFAGGQGRTAQEVADSALVGCVALLGVVAMVVAAWLYQLVAGG